VRLAVLVTGLLMVAAPLGATVARAVPTAANGALLYTESHIARARFETHFNYVCGGEPGARMHAALPDRRRGREQPAVAPDGRRMAYVAKDVGGPFGRLSIYAFDTGQEHTVLDVSAAWPSWFPTDDRIAFSSTATRDGNGNVDIYSVADTAGPIAKLTTGPGEDTMPVVSPDGTRIAYVYRTDGQSQLWVMRADGTEHTPLVTSLYTANPSWAPDGRSLVFAGWTPPLQSVIASDAYRVSAEGGDVARLSPIGGEADPEYSPDGTLVAFVRGDGIWTRRLTDGFERVVVSAPLDLAQPTWQPRTATSVEPAGHEACAIKGTSADEVIEGTEQDDVILGGSGRDLIYAGAGDDIVFDEGDAEIHAGGGDDWVTPRGGQSLVLGGDGDDRISGVDAVGLTAWGQAGADYLFGGAAGDRLIGGDGYDVLLGRRGDDSLSGGGTADSLRGGAGRDALDGGPGNDVLDGSGTDVRARRGDRADALRGGVGDDYLIGGRGADFLNGQAGDDVLLSRDGFADRLLGGFGLDRAYIDFRDALRSVEQCSTTRVPPVPDPRASVGSRAASRGLRCRPRR
jgi:Ca2+-binding RTX toxin-like protein